MMAGVRDRWQALLDEGGPILADGAMGTMLFAAGLQFGDPPEVWNFDRPDVVRRIHRGYLDAGSRIVMTNTFGANRARLGMHNLEGRVAEINRTAAVLLRSEVTAAGGRALVAGDIGPSGEIMAPLGTLEPDEAADVFAEQATALVAGGADVLWIETMSDLGRDHAPPSGVPAARRRISPIIATMTFDTRGHTMMGVSPEKAVDGPAGRSAWTRSAATAVTGPRRWCRSSTRMHAAAPGGAARGQVQRGHAAAGRHAGGVHRTPATMAELGREDARRRGPPRRRLLRQHAGAPGGDGRRAHADRAPAAVTVTQATARLLLGGPLAQAVLATVAAEAAEYREAHGHAPALAVVVCGHEAPSMVYLRQILRGCEKVGLEGRLVEIEGDAPERGLINALRGLGEDPEVAGIIVQMPLPASLSGSARWSTPSIRPRTSTASTRSTRASCAWATTDSCPPRPTRRWRS